MKYLLSGSTILVLVVLSHFAGVALGIYDAQIDAGFVWYDNILHAFVGVGFGIIWLGFLKKKRPDASRSFMIWSTLGFVFGMALAWELFEAALYFIFNSQAIAFKVYSPSLHEAAADSFSNLLGGALLLLAGRK